MNSFIPLSIPNFEGNEEEYALEAVRQGWVSTGGAYITELEHRLEDFLKVPIIAACQSGTAALHMALIESGVMPGDSVIVPTLTFIAAVNPVRYQFANPVFMDCDNSLCMDPGKLLQFCEQECRLIEGKLIHKKTKSHIKALVVVHIFGNLADMEKIMDVAETYHLKVIEDATEALGSYYTEGRYAGKYAGTIGDFGAYSFNGNKIITTGGGGALTAKKPEDAEHAKYISTQAKDDPLFYIHHEVGYNYRMTNLQAALGAAQMEELPEFIRRKQHNYEIYQDLFQNYEKAELLPFRTGVNSNKWFYSLMIHPEQTGKAIAEIIAELQNMGVQTRPIWGLIHKQKPYSSFEHYKIHMAEYYSRRIINIPCSTQLKKKDIEYVAETIIKIL